MTERLAAVWLFISDHPELWSLVVWPLLTGLVSIFHQQIEPRFPRIVTFLKAAGLDLPRAWGALRKVAPKVPPLPPTLGGALALAFFVAGCGCTTDICRATVAANAMHDVGDAAAVVIDQECTKRYQASKSSSEIAEIDEGCMPTAAAFGAFRRAHAVLVARLAAGDGVVSAALKAAQEAAMDLAVRLSEMSR